jgi:hypothetical protein
MSEDPNAAKVFDAAKAIVETLTGLDRAYQELAIRFASESLGLASSHHPVQPPVPTPGHPAAAPSASPYAPAPAKDIREFVAAKAPKSDQQFAAVVAYFYRFEAPQSLKKESIGAKDLTDAARLAGRKRPKKPIATLNNAKASGYLDSTKPGKFQISTVGENLVAVTLPGNEPAQANNRGKVTRKAPTKSRRKKTTKASS